MRPSWDDIFMKVAIDVADRSTCDRAHVGAVIVSPMNRIVSTGYNGAPKKRPHCDDVGHLMVDGHCVRTIHAESNAIADAGIDRTIGGTIYTTHFPCIHCANLIVQADIVRLVFLHGYRISPEAMDILTPTVFIQKYTTGVLDK